GEVRDQPPVATFDSALVSLHAGAASPLIHNGGKTRLGGVRRIESFDEASHPLRGVMERMTLVESLEEQCDGRFLAMALRLTHALRDTIEHAISQLERSVPELPVRRRDRHERQSRLLCKRQGSLGTSVYELRTQLERLAVRVFHSQDPAAKPLLRLK